MNTFVMGESLEERRKFSDEQKSRRGDVLISITRMAFFPRSRFWYHCICFTFSRVRASILKYAWL